jgi:hypothetical protein
MLGLVRVRRATKFHVSNTSGATQVRVSSDTDVSFSATATGADQRLYDCS